jgi:hypothetical protein
MVVLFIINLRWDVSANEQDLHRASANKMVLKAPKGKPFLLIFKPERAFSNSAKNGLLPMAERGAQMIAGGRIARLFREKPGRGGADFHQDR